MSAKLRVLHVVGALTGGGIQTFLLALMEAHAAMGISADVVCMAREPGELAPRVEAMGGRVDCLPLRGGLLAFPQGFSRILARGYDVVHAHRSSMIQALPLLLAARAGVPVRVAHFQNIANPGATSDLRKWATPVLRRLLLHAATHIVAVSEAAAVSHFPEGKPSSLRIIHNGIRTSVYTADPQQRALARGDIGIGDDDFLVVHSGRFSAAKNQEGIIRIAAALQGTERRVIFALAGDGAMRAACESLARSLNVEDRVRFMGWQDNMRVLLAAADCFLFPSRWEGMPLALIEAMAAGLPCICSDIAPNREALPDALWVRRFPAANPLRAVPIVGDLVAHPELCRALGEAARRRAADFDIDGIARQIAVLYAGGDKEHTP